MTKRLLKGLLVLILASFSLICSASSRFRTADLKCESLIEPIAIATTRPYLNWKTISHRDGASVTAYQILAATTPERLTEKKADLWNSGKVTASSPCGIEYCGHPLSSRSQVYWKVRVWDEKGKASKWSSPAYFGVGFISDKDWDNQASFIGISQTDDPLCHISPILRKQFEYHAGKDEKVFLHVNSLGYHHAYINGRPVSSLALNPAVSEFRKRSLIVTYEITDMLRDGENEVVLWTGIGWYHKRIPGVVAGGPYVRAQMEAVGAAGHKVITTTNSTWQAAESGRYGLGNKWTTGECLDMRKAVTSLDQESLASLDWQAAVIADIPPHTASPQMCEPNAIYQTFKPITVHKVADDNYVYDFGYAFVGQVEVKMPVVEEGKEIRFFYEDFYLTDAAKCREIGDFSDRFIGDGKSEAVFANKFQYKALRYIKIKGLSQPLDVSDITGYGITTDYDGDSSFECSDPDINAIHDMIHKTFRALTLGGYMVDCPHHERLGYGGDGNASTPTFQTMFNALPLYQNWMQAWADCQRENGDMPHTAPNPNRAGGGPYWCEFIITASWQTYVNYGDRRFLERYYPNMKKWVEFAESKMKNGVLKDWGNTDYRHWYLGDWATPEGINQKDSLSIDIVSNCVMSESYMTMAKIADVLGESDDAANFRNRLQQHNAMIHRTFYNGNENSYSTGTQIDLVYPMLVGATPESCVEEVVNTLKKNTEERFKGHLSAGLVGVPVLTQWAIREKEAEFVYGMLKKRGYPGYLYMLDNGADMTWEHWNGRRSHIHNCYNGIGSWFYQALAGILPDEKEPGYSHFFIVPQIVSGIDWVKASKNTPYGKIAVEWKTNNKIFTIDVCVPPSSTASISLPDGQKFELGPGSHSLSCRYK